MHVFPLLLATALSVGQTSAHDEKNPLFHELVTKGVAVGPDIFVRLSTPFMADGLGAIGQMAAIEKLADNQASMQDVLRDSPLAKHFAKIRVAKPSDPEAPAHQIDVWFIAHGDFDGLARKDPQAFLNLGRKDTKAKALSKTDLAKRKIQVGAKDGARESFLHISYSVFDQVQVSVTTHDMVSQTADSLLLARRLEPALTGDPEFPNQWRKLQEDGAGKTAPTGPPVRYLGFGQYMKITRLAEPTGALFVEYHQVFTEPKGWFEGPNVLRTKLPLLVQAEVRAFRREVKKWSSER